MCPPNFSPVPGLSASRLNRCVYFHCASTYPPTPTGLSSLLPSLPLLPLLPLVGGADARRQRFKFLPVQKTVAIPNSLGFLIVGRSRHVVDGTRVSASLLPARKLTLMPNQEVVRKTIRWSFPDGLETIRRLLGEALQPFTTPAYLCHIDVPLI